MEENSIYEKKSLRLFNKKNPDWGEIAKDCVCFANSKGGHIIIGIEDDSSLPPENQKIPDDLRNSIQSQIQNRTINTRIEVILQVAENDAEYLDIIIKRSSSSIASTTKGQYYIRIDDTCKPVLPDELSRLMDDKSAFVWELKQYIKVNRNEYDNNKLNQFIKNIKESDRVSDFVKQKNIEELMEHYFLADGKYLTNLWVLWIGKRTDRAKLLFAPSIQFIKYDENENKIKKIVWDNFDSNPKELIHTVWDAIPEFQESIEFSDGLFRKNISNYDEVVIRELLVNALVHKPYTTRGDIFINLFADRLEIHNPGLLPLGVTPKNILHKSVQRNPHLAKIFYDLKLMEKEGSGYDVIYQTLLSSGKKLPIVYEGEDRVTVTVDKAIVNKDVINFIEKVVQNHDLKSKELLSLSLIALHNSLSLIELSDIFGLNELVVTNDWIARLIKLDLIKKSGRTKGTQYSVNPILLRAFNYKGKTNLRSIEPHRIRELIREDLRKYPKSSRNEIHIRIGKEISERLLRTQIKQLLNDEIIIKIGSTNNAKYSLTVI